MRKLCALCFLFISVCFGDGIEGFWKTVNDETGKPGCIVAVYPYQGRYYGKIVGSYDDSGKMEDTIYAPKGRATGVNGSPFYCGLDFIWDMKLRGSRYKGKIMDPRNGDVYKAELWTEGGNLIVRGKLLFFGRNETWLPAVASDFPPGFKKPDLNQLVPAVPDVD